MGKERKKMMQLTPREAEILHLALQKNDALSMVPNLDQVQATELNKALDKLRDLLLNIYRTLGE
jgi:hypothetical protein